MAGNFDSAVSALSFWEGSIASTTTVATASQSYVLPYDIEVLSAAVTGTPAAGAQFIWADVQRIPVGTTTATSLFSPPFSAANINTVKLDQSYVTAAVTATAAQSTLNGTATATVTATVTSATNFAVGQGVVVAGTNTPGNYITAISSNTLTLKYPVTGNNGATIVAVTSPTPQPGQSVQILGVTNAAVAGGVPSNFFSVLNNVTTGAPAQTVYTVVSATESTTAPYQTFRFGPIKQAGLYDTSTGFWRFTTDTTTLSAGTFQIIEAPVLPGAASGATIATVNYPDVVSRASAGDLLRVIWRAVDNKGVLRTTTATATNVTLSLAVKKA